MADVLPIGVPSRAELWRRHQLARAVLQQRPADETTNALVLRALDGASLESLMRWDIHPHEFNQEVV